MTKKAIGLLLALGMMTTLAACGGTDGATDGGASPSPESPAATTSPSP